MRIFGILCAVVCVLVCGGVVWGGDGAAGNGTTGDGLGLAQAAVLGTQAVAPTTQETGAVAGVEGYLAAAEVGVDGGGRTYWVDANASGISVIVRMTGGGAKYLTLSGNVVTGVFGRGFGAWMKLDGPEKREVWLEGEARPVFGMVGVDGKLGLKIGLKKEGEEKALMGLREMWNRAEKSGGGKEVFENGELAVVTVWDEKVMSVAIVGKKEKALRSLWVATRTGVPLVSVVVLDGKAAVGEGTDFEGARKEIQGLPGWSVMGAADGDGVKASDAFLRQHRGASVVRGEMGMEREALFSKLAGIGIQEAKKEYIGRIREYWSLLNEEKLGKEVKALLANSVRAEMAHFRMEKDLWDCFGEVFEGWGQKGSMPWLETADAQGVYEAGAVLLKARKDKRYVAAAEAAGVWLAGQKTEPAVMLSQKRMSIGLGLLGLMDKEKRSALLLCAPMRVWMGGLEKRIEGTATVLLGGATRDWTSEDFLALLKDIQTHDGEEAAANFLVTFCYGNQEPSARYGGEAFVSYLIEKAPLMRKGPNVHFLLRAVEGSVTGKAREMFEQAVMDDALFSLDAVALAALAGDALRGRMGPASFRMRMGADLKKPLDAKDEDRVVNGFLSAGIDDSVVDDLAGVLMRTKDPMLATTVLDTFYFGLKNKTVTRKKVFERVREYVRKSDEPRMDRVLMMVDPELKPTLLEKMTGVKVSREMIAIARSKEWVLAHRAEVVGLLDDAIAGPK